MDFLNKGHGECFWFQFVNLEERFSLLSVVGARSEEIWVVLLAFIGQVATGYTMV